MTLDWHDEASEEFSQAAIYYEQQYFGLGERFITHVDAAIARLRAAPFMPRCFDGDCRKVRVEKFPYAIIYRIEQEKLQIIALMNLKRRPGYWKIRMDG